MRTDLSDFNTGTIGVAHSEIELVLKYLMTAVYQFHFRSLSLTNMVPDEL